MADTSDIKNGLCFELKSQLYKVVEFLHVKPGKGAAFVRTKIKNLNNGKTIDHTFNAGTKINVVRIENRDYQFLYKDDMGHNFMNTADYEQVSIMEELINAPKFLKEGEICDVMFHAENETPLSVDLPQFVQVEITYTEPGLKGDTATNATKHATIETGAEVRVPLFINEGDSIKLDTAKGAYVERIKK